MASDTANEMTRPLPIALLLLAIVGWLLVAYLWYDAGRDRRDLEAALQAERSAAQQVGTELAALSETAGAREELDSIVQSLRAEQDGLTEERDALLAELESARAEQAELANQVTTQQAELESLQAEAAPLDEQLATFDQRLAEAERSVVERTQELADVGQRLEEARVREAELQQTLAQLTEDAAQTTEAAADSEERLQAAREAEAELETRLAAARDAFDQIAREQAGLEEHVATLTETRNALIGDTTAAEEQRQAVETQLTQLTDTLASRADDLAALEARVAELQSGAAEVNRAAAAGLIPGQYVMGPIVAVFASDGTFEMANVERGTSATGRYAVEDDVLSLTDVEGDIGQTAFPIHCAVAPEATGFSLHDEDGTCAVFSGQLFQRAG